MSLSFQSNPAYKLKNPPDFSDGFVFLSFFLKEHNPSCSPLVSTIIGSVCCLCSSLFINMSYSLIVIQRYEQNITLSSIFTNIFDIYGCMHDFIKNLIRKKLTEANITTHALERAEERVWGNKSLSYNGTNPDPPTLNKDAWANSDKYPKIDVQTAKNGIETIPATNLVIGVMENIRFVKNLNVIVNLGENEIIFLIVYKSNSVQRGGNIWGNILVASCFPTPEGGNVVTLEWKNTTDLTQFKKGVSTPKYVVDVNDLIRKNITTLDDNNISELSIYGKKKNIEAPKRDKFKTIKLINGEKINYYQDSNRFEKLDGTPISTDDIFDKLNPEWQKVVFDKLNEGLNL